MLQFRAKITNSPAPTAWMATSFDIGPRVVVLLGKTQWLLLLLVALALTAFYTYDKIGSSVGVDVGAFVGSAVGEAVGAGEGAEVGAEQTRFLTTLYFGELA